jgi:hypothetical protein
MANSLLCSLLLPHSLQLAGSAAAAIYARFLTACGVSHQYDQATCFIFSKSHVPAASYAPDIQ